MIAILGLCMLRRKASPPGIILSSVYGLLVLVFGAIPLMTEGAALEAYGELDYEKDIKPMCQIQDLESADINKVTKALLGLAKNYDTQMENLLDKYMCTDTCPCYSEEKWATTDSGVRIKRIDPEFTFREIHEDKLNLHGRTNKTAAYNNFQPLVFSTDRSKSYESFAECFNLYKIKGLADPKFLPRNVFDLSFIPENFEELKKEDTRQIYKLLNYELMTIIETEHECSGFC